MDLQQLYAEIYWAWRFHLMGSGIKMPYLIRGNKYTKDALTLIFLYTNYNKIVKKSDIEDFVIHTTGEKSYDGQQARHMANKGWCIDRPSRGEYRLSSLNKCNANFNQKRRDDTNLDWDKLLAEYKNRCAVCGSKDGEISFKNNSITKLEKGHMDPNKQMNNLNIIPMCDYCNKAYKDQFTFNENGIINGINVGGKVYKINEAIKILEGVKNV